MKTLLLILLMLFPILLFAQQRPDTSFQFNIEKPSYNLRGGPTVCIDSAHNNFHTKNGGFAPFTRVIQEDGYNVTDYNDELTLSDSLTSCEIFIIVNPIHENNLGNWVLPNPSAFTTQEIQNLNNWVEQGGALLLIADHMPFAGAAYDLAISFGFRFSNGFAILEKEQNQPDLFTFENGRLIKSPVSGDEITTITSYTGSAFQYPEEATPVMVFKKGDYSLEPETAWQFQENTDTLNIENYAQGALLNYGSGKIAVFGEAAMFTAQIVDTDQGEFKFGINNRRIAPQNLDFLLNVMHWLD